MILKIFEVFCVKDVMNSKGESQTKCIIGTRHVDRKCKKNLCETAIILDSRFRFKRIKLSINNLISYYI